MPRGRQIKPELESNYGNVSVNIKNVITSLEAFRGVENTVQFIFTLIVSSVAINHGGRSRSLPLQPARVIANL